MGTISGLNKVKHIKQLYTTASLGLLGGSDGKQSASNAGDQVRSLDWEDPLEKGMATYSGTLAWEIPWTEDPHRLQPTRLQRFGHD